MKNISLTKLSNIVKTNREKLNITQKKLCELTGINRAMISKIETGDYAPSIEQIEALGNSLNFEYTDIFEDDETKEKFKNINLPKMNIAVAGTGYVGLSIATLLAQHHHITAVDVIEEKVNLINDKKSPIQDEYIEKYLSEKKLDLFATLNAERAYKDAKYVVVAAPTNYDPQKNYFDTSAVETVIDLVLEYNPEAWIVIKSTIPVGFTARMRKEKNTNHILFSPEFLRESKALYDNLYP